MKNSKAIIGIVVLVIFIIGLIAIIIRVPKTTETVVIPSTTASTTASVGKSYTLADVQIHKTPADCWTTISGKVYELTSWIKNHPGGQEAIISLAV